MSRVGEENTNNFGSRMIIKEYRNSLDVDIYFPEYKWIIRNVRYDNFKRGYIKCPYEPRIYSAGYLGEGPFSTRINGKKTRIYDTWHDMLRRCYDHSYKEKHPTYAECEVCKEWLNYQNFAQWYEQNYYEINEEIMNLDKDILIKGNKIYSPNTCIFVPQNINKLFIKCNAARGDLPIGVTYKKQCRKYAAVCRINGSNKKHLGYYNTSEEAFQAYKVFKENLIKQIANQYIDLIPQSLYDAMINYEVEYDD